MSCVDPVALRLGVVLNREARFAERLDIAEHRASADAARLGEAVSVSPLPRLEPLQEVDESCNSLGVHAYR